MTNDQTTNSPWVAYLASADGWVYQSADDAAEDVGVDGEVRIGVARGTCAPVEDDGALRLPGGTYSTGDQVFELETYIDGEGNEAESAEVRFAQAKAMAAGLNAAAGLPAVTVERPDDETVEIHVNGQVVASANHDEHGWSGMDAVEKTALAVVRAFGAAVAA
ncbi:hypothetical protein AB0K35_28350 [Micromonospora sp. NPDC053740]|uniref:hypothetical protein n=1 Tax=Micromonospora sp. NPDC053740 TaxID=3155173 RepID=UPI00343406BC